MAATVTGRTPSLSRAVMVAAALVLAAAAVFLVAVRTPTGQRIDQWLLDAGRRIPKADVPAIVTIDIVSNPLLWLGVAAAVVVLIQLGRFRSRAEARHTLIVTVALLSFPPAAILVARILRDHVLTRPQLHDWITETANSAPSGHAAAVTAVAVVLILATPPVLRPLIGIVLGGWAAVIGVSLVAAGWHRPSDVLISVLLVAAAGMLLPDPWRGPRRRRVEEPTSADRPDHPFERSAVDQPTDVVALSTP
ncbi:phosphatase PAP2 family protein [Gordonia sp. DT101]|uniref:phosphatase PAP2 family protein n=1 Tax=Gordonia sp. DT101 TaxID=3416545 RepID=UPI003CF06492